MSEEITRIRAEMREAATEAVTWRDNNTSRSVPARVGVDADDLLALLSALDAAEARAEAVEEVLSLRTADLKEAVARAEAAERERDEARAELEKVKGHRDGVAASYLRRVDSLVAVAADRDSLSALLQKARETLEPFADCVSEGWEDFAGDEAVSINVEHHTGFTLVVKDFEGARSICEQIDAARIGDGVKPPAEA